MDRRVTCAGQGAHITGSQYTVPSVDLGGELHPSRRPPQRTQHGLGTPYADQSKNTGTGVFSLYLPTGFVRLLGQACVTWQMFAQSRRLGTVRLVPRIMFVDARSGSV